MNDQGHYPPPDFGCPPPGTIPDQQQHASGFHPSMWSWGDTSSEPVWDHSGQAGWQHGAAAGFGSPPCRGNYGHKRPHGELSIMCNGHIENTGICKYHIYIPIKRQSGCQQYPTGVFECCLCSYYNYEELMCLPL